MRFHHRIIVIAAFSPSFLLAQPGPTTPLPTILHQPVRPGGPVRDTYLLTDTIAVRVTGHVLLDGDCGSGRPLYGFQRMEEGEWTNYLPADHIQMMCGLPSDEWVDHPVPLIPTHIARPAYGKPWKPGVYRAVILLVGHTELIGAPFTVLQGPEQR
jgi:hypothetical protein